jgi:hypothetical protein
MFGKNLEEDTSISGIHKVKFKNYIYNFNKLYQSKIKNK